MAVFFFMECAVSELAFSGLASAVSAGWLAMRAFCTASLLLINDFFGTDIVVLLRRALAPDLFCPWIKPRRYGYWHARCQTNGDALIHHKSSVLICMRAVLVMLGAR
jgi:hypothetical protein